MPSRSYHEFIIKDLLDPEYSSLYIQISLEETIKDRDLRAFKRALNNALEAAYKRQTPVAEIYASRQQVYRKLLELETLTVEAAEEALKTVGIVPEKEPAEV